MYDKIHKFVLGIYIWIYSGRVLMTGPLRRLLGPRGGSHEVRGLLGRVWVLFSHVQSDVLIVDVNFVVCCRVCMERVKICGIRRR